MGSTSRRHLGRAAIAAVLAVAVSTAQPSADRAAAAGPVDTTPVYTNLTGTVVVEVDHLRGTKSFEHFQQRAVYTVDMAEDASVSGLPWWSQHGVTIAHDLTYSAAHYSDHVDDPELLCALTDREVRAVYYPDLRLSLHVDPSAYGSTDVARIGIGTGSPGFHVDTAVGSDCSTWVPWYEAEDVLDGADTCLGTVPAGTATTNVGSYVETATAVAFHFDCTNVTDDAQYGQHFVVHIVADLHATKRPGRLQPLSPARVMDTRADGTTVDGRYAAIGARAAGSTTELVIAGRASVPLDASAVVLNVAVTEPTAGGFLTLYPCGSARPLAASINFAAGQTISNAVTAQLGTGGATCVYAHASTHVVIDVTAAYPADAGFQGLVPARLLETRPGERTVDGRYEGTGALSARTSTAVVVVGRGGVPTNANTVVLNVAVTDPQADGYLTIYPCDFSRPNASSLNYRAGQTISNAVTAKVGFFDGDICIYTLATTHVVVDVTGALAGGVGFMSIQPVRLLETRPGYGTIDGIAQMLGIRAAGSTTTVAVAGRVGVPDTATAVVLNVAVTEPTGPGFLTVYPCSEARPLAASLNYEAGQTISNAVTAKLGSGGAICVYTSARTHVIIDAGASQS